MVFFDWQVRQVLWGIGEEPGSARLGEYLKVVQLGARIPCLLIYFSVTKVLGEVLEVPFTATKVLLVAAERTPISYVPTMHKVLELVEKKG